MDQRHFTLVILISNREVNPLICIKDLMILGGGGKKKTTKKQDVNIKSY